jgi:DNA-directed RNA polymerase subunit RPC12/RpoP
MLTENGACGNCGSEVHRSHRTFLEQFWCARAWKCRECGRRFRERRPFLERYVTCPRCGTSRLSVLGKPDTVDRMHRGALHVLGRLLGGALYHCSFCRLQFYDVRGRRVRQ